LLPKVLGFDTIDEVLRDLQTGASIDDFTQKIRNYAKTAMPEYVKKLIDQGQDLTDIISPYRATISDVLDIPFNSIDVTDKNIQNALAGNISLAELRKQLRKDDRWQYTDTARSEVANVTRQVLQDFGFMG
jgi:cysteinyl-tRNA synthetase